jgi:hypothetical protein
MKKSIVSSAIALSIMLSAEASANLTITEMFWVGGTSAADGPYISTGTIKDDGNLGTLESVDDFFTFPWSATQETAVITNSNGATWAGSSVIGVWDYSVDISNMSDDQVAVGIFFDWNNQNGLPVLAVFDCVSTPGECLGQREGVGGYIFGGIQAGAIVGSGPMFNGIGNLVPVPAAAWLMGSGLITLIGLARRRKSL